MPKTRSERRRQTSHPVPLHQNDFETFFELAGVGHVISDIQDSRILRVNSTFCALTGYTPEELSGLTSYDLTHPDDRAADRTGWHQALEQDEVYFEIEKRYVRKDGQTIWVNVTSTVVKDERGTPLRAIGVVRDIGPQRRFEEDAKQIRAQLEHRVTERTQNIEQVNQTLLTLINASPLAIIGLNPKHEVTMWNRRAEELFGWREKDVLGHPLPNLPKDPKLVREMKALLDSRTPFSMESHRRRKDDSLIEVRVWYAPTFTPDQQFAGHVGLLMDLAETRFLESALLEAGEREQRRLGQDLHDHLCQHLLGAAFAAKALSGSLVNTPASSQLNDLARNINEAVVQIRDIARGLHPVEVDAAGLMSSLSEMAQRLSRMVPCEFVCRRSVPIHHPKTALQAYRIAQESVSILLHHYRTDSLRIELSKKGSTATLSLSASRPGREPEDTPEAILDRRILEYRAKSIGGSITIESLPKIIKILCQFPLSHHEY